MNDGNYKHTDNDGDIVHIVDSTTITSCGTDGEKTSVYLPSSTAERITMALAILGHHPAQVVPVSLDTRDDTRRVRSDLYDLIGSLTGETRSAVRRTLRHLERLSSELEQVRTDRDRFHTAWQSARVRAADTRESAEMSRWFAYEFSGDVLELRRALAAARAERDQLRDQRDQLAAEAEPDEDETDEDDGYTHTWRVDGRTVCGLSGEEVTTVPWPSTCPECDRHYERLADRQDYATLSPEPGDEVPDLAELSDRIAALEQRLDAAE